MASHQVVICSSLIGCSDSDPYSLQLTGRSDCTARVLAKLKMGLGVRVSEKAK